MEKERWEEPRRRTKEVRRSEKRKRERRKRCTQVREKVRKSRFTLFFPMICGSGGSRSRLAKVGGAKPAGQMRDEKLHADMARSTFWKSTFRSWDVEKVCAPVARNTFPSQNVQSTLCSDHFWKFMCRKSARCTKHTILGPLLEVEMSNKCTPLWGEAHFEVKSVKNN